MLNNSYERLSVSHEQGETYMHCEIVHVYWVFDLFH